MKILVAPAQFKTSLPADGVAREMEKGVRKALPEASIILKPLADGGEGTVRIITRALGGKEVKTLVSNPLGEKIKASFGLVYLPFLNFSPPFLSKKGQAVKTAVLEMAAAAGLSLIPEKLRNPLNTTTYGVGELILKAVEKGVQQIILGLGDSATNDGGLGALTALGIEFFDRQKRPLKPVGSSLKKVASFKINLKNPELMKVKIFLATDVKNPLLGKKGATRVFASQKGAHPQEVEALEKGMANWAKILFEATGKKEELKPGAGAAGGLGFGLSHFLPTFYLPGALLIQEILEVDKALEKAQAVFSGEGSFDEKSLSGKAPFLLLSKAAQKKIPVFLIAGKIRLNEEKLKKLGVAKSLSLISLAQREEESKKKVKALIRKAAWILAQTLTQDHFQNFSKT